MRSTTKIFTLLLFLTACQGVPPVVLNSSLRVRPELDELRPVDIAVLPIEDATPAKTATPHLEVIRSQVAQALVQRHYSPLSQAMVDQRMRETGAGPGPSVVDASYQRSMLGRFGEDAVLGLTVVDWDESTLMKNSRVNFTARVSLMHSASRQILWAGDVDGSVKAGGDGVAPRRRPDRASAAAKTFAEAVIETLPIRRMQ
ncbi:MAG: GNA1162 family protein [Planctomycetota bacterium]|jgi:hypothetical protein